MVEIKTVAIVGAGGNIGEAILAALLETSLKVTVISRPESTSKFDPSINIIKTSYDLDGLTAAFKGQDAVLSCLSIQAVDSEPTLIDAAVAAGVRWFLPSEYGHPMEDRVVERLPPLKKKVASIEHLKLKEREGLNWTAVITGLFFDWGLTFSFLGLDIPNRTADLWDDGETKFSTVNIGTIGLAVANLLTSSAALEEAKNKYIYISSATTSQLELLGIAEKVTGEKWAVKKNDSKKVIADATKALATGDFSVIGSLIRSVSFAEGWSRFDEKADKWNKLLSLEIEEDAEETVRRVVTEKTEKA